MDRSMRRSLSVGTFSKPFRRWSPMTASILNLPAATWDETSEGEGTTASIWPPSRATTAGALPWYGMWLKVAPSFCCRPSAARCETPPTPALPKRSPSLLRLAASTNSSTVFQGDCALTASTTGSWLSRTMGTKSSGWYLPMPRCGRITISRVIMAIL